MQLIKQGYTPIDITNPNNILQQIEIAGRTCYKSEHKTTKSSAVGFVEMLLRNNHMAMLEFGYHPIISIHRDNIEETPFNDLIYNTRLNEKGIKYLNITFNVELERFLISSSIRGYIEFIESYVGDFDVDSILTLLTDKYPIFFNRFRGLNNIYNNMFTLFNVEYDENNIITNMNNVEISNHIYEHILFTTDRGVSHELVRHRVAGYAQESTRYCNYGNSEHLTYIVPSSFPTITEGTYVDGTDCTPAWALLDNNLYKWYHNLIDIEALYKYLVSKDNETKWTPQLARDILPNILKTDINIIANIQEWQHIFELRHNKKAHPQMNNLMDKVIPYFISKYNNILTID